MDAKTAASLHMKVCIRLKIRFTALEESHFERFSPKDRILVLATEVAKAASENAGIVLSEGQVKEIAKAIEQLHRPAELTRSIIDAFTSIIQAM